MIRESNYNEPFPFEDELRDDVHHIIEHVVHVHRAECRHENAVYDIGYVSRCHRNYDTDTYVQDTNCFPLGRAPTKHV